MDMEDSERTSRRRGPYGKRKRDKVEDIALSDAHLFDVFESTLASERDSDRDVPSHVSRTQLPSTYDVQMTSLHTDNLPGDYSENELLPETVSSVDGAESDTLIIDSDQPNDTSNAEQQNDEYTVDNDIEKINNSDPELDQLFYDVYRNMDVDHEDKPDVDYDSDCELQYSNLDADAINLTVEEDSAFESQPLYPGATVTVGAFMLLLGLYFTKHNATGDAIVQMLNILAMAFPSGNNICTSLSAFKKFFCKLKNPLIYHYYCNYCLGYIGIHPIHKCTFVSCGKNLDKNENLYFLEMSLETQLENLFSQKGFTDKLLGRFDISHGTFKDIQDGELYKSYFDNGGPLSQPENISFTFNTDGAPVFKSSKVSVWPLFLVLNELPYSYRMKRENMILAGLWFGNKKPSMGTYLCPFLKTFNALNNGIELYSPDKGLFKCRGFLLCGTADLPARCLLCNHIQFNGAFACWKCKQKGETAKVGKGHAHVFPFMPENPKGPERNKQNVIDDARKALDNQELGSKISVVNGIKGPSWLSFFPKFNIVDGIAIDYMHGILLGVQKLLLKLWFTPSYKGKPFNFNDHVMEVDKRLENIKPTLDISRLPRSIENDLKYWKASEFRSFLLFFGAPVLLGILDKTRFNHYLLLINAMHLLLKCGSTHLDINRAENMLFDFCKNFAILYDKCYMTLNIHQLVHLADSVRCLGPLYTHSCFSFEDKNGFMLKMIRGTQNIDNQIITGISFLQKLPELKQKFISKDTDIEKLYESIESPNLLKRGIMLEKGCYVLGALKERTLLADELSEICQYLGFAPLKNVFQSFKRLELGNNLVYSSEYARMTKRDNSTVLYRNGGKVSIGRVRCFLLVTEEHGFLGNKSAALSVVENLHCPAYDETSNILSVKMTNSVSMVPILNIEETCMFLSVFKAGKPDDFYVCRFPNRLELD